MKSSPYYSEKFHTEISQLFQTHSILLNKLFLINTAILEAIKLQILNPQNSSNSLNVKNNANLEYLLLLIYNFLSNFLYIWGYEIGAKTFQALTGPYLAQLIQSTLTFSQHRFILFVFLL